MKYEDFIQKKSIKKILKERKIKFDKLYEQLNQLNKLYKNGKIEGVKYSQFYRFLLKKIYPLSPILFAYHLSEERNSNNRINKRHFEIWDEFLYLLLEKHITRACFIGIKNILKTTLSCDYFTALITLIKPEETVVIHRANYDTVTERISDIEDLIENNEFLKKVYSDIKPGKVWDNKKGKINIRKGSGYNFLGLSVSNGSWGSEKGDYHIWDDPQNPEMQYEKKKFEKTLRALKRSPASIRSKNSVFLIVMNPLFEGDLLSYIKDDLNPRLKKNDLEEYIILEEGAFSDDVEINSNNAEEVMKQVKTFPDHYFKWKDIWNKKNILQAYEELPSSEFFPLIIGVVPPSGQAIFKGKYEFVKDFPKTVELIPVIDPAKGSESSIPNPNSSYNAMIILAVDHWDDSVVKPSWVIDVMMRKCRSWMDFLNTAADEIRCLYDYALKENMVFRKVIIEDNLKFSPHLKELLIEKGIGDIKVEPVISTENKDFRINSIEADMRSGKLKFLDKSLVKHPEDYELLIDELDNYPHINHYDGLDALSIGQISHKPKRHKVKTV